MISDGDCIASISGQGMAAKLAWDGTIEMEETIAGIRWGTRWNVPALADNMSYQTMEELKKEMSDVVGTVVIGALAMPINTV